MVELRSRYLFTITMKLPPTLELGDTPSGNRRVFTVSGGRFFGDRLRGEVLPEASSDLLLVRGDGSYQQDVRLILRTDDSALILMTYRGVRHASPEVGARIARGDQVALSELLPSNGALFRDLVIEVRLVKQDRERRSRGTGRGRGEVRGL